MKTLTELTITRSKWGTPDKVSCSLLLGCDGLMCCLGFACLAIGIKKQDILGITMPAAIKNPPPQLTDLGRLGRLGRPIISSQFSRDAAVINDDVGISNPEREAQLTKLFAQNNIKLTFVD